MIFLAHLLFRYYLRTTFRNIHTSHGNGTTLRSGMPLALLPRRGRMRCILILPLATPAICLRLEDSKRGLYKYCSVFTPFFVRSSGFSASKTAVFSPGNNFFCQDPVIINFRGLDTNFVISDPNIPYSSQF